MGYLAGQAHLVQEQLEPLRVLCAGKLQELERHRHREHQVLGVVDGSHGPAAQQPAFSVNISTVEAACRYIENQEVRHQTESFKEEFLRILNEYDIEYDERYIWD